MVERSQKYYAAKRKAGEWIASYNSARYDDDGFKVTCLERALEAQREAAAIEAAFKEALEPCRACGRKVTSPCHDYEGYYTEGPWDSACEDLVRKKPVA